MHNYTKHNRVGALAPVSITALFAATIPLAACTVHTGGGDESDASGTGMMDATGGDMTTSASESSGTAADTSGSTGTSGTGGTGATDSMSSGTMAGTEGGTSADSTGSETGTSGGDTGSRGQVAGYFDGDAGYQKSAARWPLQETDWTSASTEASVAAMVDGTFHMVGSATINSMTEFNFEAIVAPDDADAGVHPIVVTFAGDAGHSASALGWVELDSDGEVVGTIELPPVGHESSLEVQATTAVASELGAWSEVNVPGLTALVTAELSARVSDGAELSSALIGAQTAELSALADASGEAISAAELQAIESSAYAEFIAKLRADTDVRSQFEAHVEYLQQVQADLATELELEAQQVADASVQSSWAFANSVKASGHAAADLAATAAGQLAFWADLTAAHTTAVEGELDQSVVEELEAQIAAYIDASASAADTQAVLDAQAEVESQLGMADDELGAVIEAWIEASGGAELTVRSQVKATMALVVELRAELETALSVASDSADAVELAAKAQADFEAAVRTQWEAAATVAGMGAADIDFFTQLSCVGRVSTKGLIEQR